MITKKAYTYEKIGIQILKVHRTEQIWIIIWKYQVWSSARNDHDSTGGNKANVTKWGVPGFLKVDEIDLNRICDDFILLITLSFLILKERSIKLNNLEGVSVSPVLWLANSKIQKIVVSNPVPSKILDGNGVRINSCTQFWFIR